MREFCEIAFNYVGKKWEDHVVVDPEFFRPAEVNLLIGDATKARTVLGWNPTVPFEGLVTSMVKADLAAVKRENR